MKPRHLRHQRLFALAPLAALLAIAMQAGPGTDPDPFPRCQAVLEPDSVAVAPEPIQLAFSVPDSIGTVTTATADEDSGIVVAGVDSEAKTVTVDTRSALEGSWTLTFTSDSARTCIGNLNVVLQKRGSER